MSKTQILARAIGNYPKKKIGGVTTYLSAIIEFKIGKK